MLMKTCIVELFLVVLFGCFFLTACTISLTNVSSIGHGEDVVDTEQDPTNDVKPNVDVSLPVKAI